MEIAEPNNDAVELFPTLKKAEAEERTVRESLQGRGRIQILQTKDGEYLV